MLLKFNVFKDTSFKQHLLSLNMAPDQLLHEPIEALGFSPAFCARARQMGFSRLEDILLQEPKEIMADRDFSYAWLAELAGFLKERGLLHLLQPIPGKTRG